MSEILRRKGLDEELDDQIDAILDLLDRAGKEGVELDPLAAIFRRLAARGENLDMSEAPPLIKMLLSGMGVSIE